VPASYTAVSTFVPEVRGQQRLGGGLGSLAGLATQFGVSLGADPAESPRFYAKVAESRQILERLLLTRFPRPGNSALPGDSASLLVLLEVDGRDRADSIHRAIRKLRRRLSVSVEDQTNVVTVSIEAADRSLASAATNRLVEYLNDFNSQVRRSQAHERRLFVEQRVVDGEQDLRRAEQQLREFYERNRSWQQSPQLVFHEGRLRREVDIREEIYLTLQRQYETARIEEVNDVPLITVIDAAVPPVQRSWPKRTFLVIVAGAMTGLAVLLWVFAREYVDRARREELEEYQQLTSAIAVARSDVRRVLGGRSERSSSR